MYVLYTEAKTNKDLATYYKNCPEERSALLQDIEYEIDGLVKNIAPLVKQVMALVKPISQNFAQIGKCLRDVRDAKLFSSRYKTFPDYVKDRWGWERNRAYKMIAAADISLTDGMLADALDNSIPGVIGIQNERQARALRKVPKEQRQEVLKAATAGGKLSARAISSAYDKSRAQGDKLGAALRVSAVLEGLVASTEARENQIPTAVVVHPEAPKIPTAVVVPAFNPPAPEFAQIINDLGMCLDGHDQMVKLYKRFTATHSNDKFGPVLRAMLEGEIKFSSFISDTIKDLRLRKTTDMKQLQDIDIEAVVTRAEAVAATGVTGVTGRRYAGGR